MDFLFQLSEIFSFLSLQSREDQQNTDYTWLFGGCS